MHCTVAYLTSVAYLTRNIKAVRQGFVETTSQNTYSGTAVTYNLPVSRQS